MSLSELIKKPGLWFEVRYLFAEIPSTSLTTFAQWLPPVDEPNKWYYSSYNCWASGIDKPIRIDKETWPVF